VLSVLMVELVLALKVELESSLLASKILAWSAASESELLDREMLPQEVEAEVVCEVYEKGTDPSDVLSIRKPSKHLCASYTPSEHDQVFGKSYR
jgi:hypothetical protein